MNKDTYEAEQAHPPAKKCSICGASKSLQDFATYRKNGKVGTRNLCRACRNAREARRRMDRGDEYREKRRSYGKVLDQAGFYRERRKALQSETLESAIHHNEEWTGPQLEIALRDNLTTREAAKMLGRSYASVKNVRYRSKEDPRMQTLAGTHRSEL